MPRGPVCVVGCNGYVGSFVVAELLGQGYSVHGVMRDPSADRSDWIRVLATQEARQGATLTLFDGEATQKQSLIPVMKDCIGVICCAGSPRIEPETTQLMVDIATNVCDAAIEAKIPAGVFTSSTGSTNPPEGEPELKNEVDHWSDDKQQWEAGKFAAAGKTRYDRIILEKMEKSGGTFRTAILNPTQILGPSFHPKPNGSLKGYAAILNGERFSDTVPNRSSSMIHVRDLAKLHVSALLNTDARGRYFGVKRSWHMRDILRTLSEIVPSYKVPPIDPNEEPAWVTQFDLTRRDSLGVEVRDIREILEDVVKELRRRNMISNGQ